MRNFAACPGFVETIRMKLFKGASKTVENVTSIVAMTEDELRLAKLGYKQEVKRIFSKWTNFGLAASMISVILGIIPLYTYSLTTGGPVVMVWSWVIVGFFTLLVVSSLAEICSAFPTMGALYYWAFRLGGDTWGPFFSWTAGWANLLGQVAGVASGGYAGAEVLSDIVFLQSGVVLSKAQFLGLYAAVLFAAGIVNTFAETLLTMLCYISEVWHVVGTILIVALMTSCTEHKKSAPRAVTQYNNGTNFKSPVYVCLIGMLAAASTFTGYDTAAHCSEETTNSHESTPWAMLMSVVNCIVLGLVLIIGMNACITDISYLTDRNNDVGAATLLWQDTVGDRLTLFFQVITFVGIECSNCANLTSCSRMVFSFSRDGAVPFSQFWYSVNKCTGTPARAVWLSVLAAFALGVPGVANEAVLGALFSMTATGLYTSYMIPIILRITVSRDSFKPAEFNLGNWSVPIGCVSVLWCCFMLSVLCMPQITPVTEQTLNYSPVALGSILFLSWICWFASARHWFKGVQANLNADDIIAGYTKKQHNIDEDGGGDEEQGKIHSTRAVGNRGNDKNATTCKDEGENQEHGATGVPPAPKIERDCLRGEICRHSGRGAEDSSNYSIAAAAAAAAVNDAAPTSRGDAVENSRQQSSLSSQLDNISIQLDVHEDSQQTIVALNGCVDSQ